MYFNMLDYIVLVIRTELDQYYFEHLESCLMLLFQVCIPKYLGNRFSPSGVAIAHAPGVMTRDL